MATLAIFGATSAASGNGATIKVSSVVELQNAVADPANAGKTVQLAPGVYYLDPTVGTTGGRLELQTDMELVGAAGNRAAVIIDASLLDATLPGAPDPAIPASYQDGTLVTGALRMGRGANAVRWMTLRRAGLGPAFIEIDLPPVPGVESSVTVEHCIIEGNNRGIDFRLFRAANSGRTMTGTFRGNLLRSNTLGMGQGIRIACLKGASDAMLRARIEGNTFVANLAGLLAASSESCRNLIAIESRNNSYSGNGVGVVAVGGIAIGSQVADDNRITFDSENDELEGNLLPTAAYAAAGAGLAATGADSASMMAGRTNRNAVSLTLRNVRCADNPVGDLVTVGARGANGVLAGTHNEVSVLLLGSTRGLLIPPPVDSDPPEPTNHVTIVP